jgi:hypothetical protein
LLEPLVNVPAALAVTSTLSVQVAWFASRVPLVTETLPLAGVAVIAVVPLVHVVETLFGLATVNPGGSASVNDQVLAASSFVFEMVNVSVAVPPWGIVAGLKAFVSCGVESVTITSSITAPHGPFVMGLAAKVSVVVLPVVLGESELPSRAEIQPMFVGLWPDTLKSKSWLNEPNDTSRVYPPATY